MANDGADGSLRLVDPPFVPGITATDVKWALEARRNADSLFAMASVTPVGFAFEVIDVFPSFFSILDIVVVPPSGVEKPAVSELGRISYRFRFRSKECWASVSASSPCSQS